MANRPQLEAYLGQTIWVNATVSQYEPNGSLVRVLLRNLQLPDGAHLEHAWLREPWRGWLHLPLGSRVRFRALVAHYVPTHGAKDTARDYHTGLCDATDLEIYQHGRWQPVQRNYPSRTDLADATGLSPGALACLKRLN